MNAKPADSTPKLLARPQETRTEAQWLAIAIQCGIIPPCSLSAFPTSDAALLTVGL